MRMPLVTENAVPFVLSMVPVHLSVRSAPRLVQVHAHAVDHVAEGLDVHGVLGDGVRQRRVQDVIGAPVEDALQPLLPPVQRLRARGAPSPLSLRSR